MEVHTGFADMKWRIQYLPQENHILTVTVNMFKKAWLPFSYLSVVLEVLYAIVLQMSVSLF